MKNITLEMIDEFISETGFDYEEARAYLLAAEGDVKLAIEAATAKGGVYGKSSMDALLGHIKDMVKKGNLLRVIIRKEDEILLNIPAGVGVLGAFLATYLSAAAIGVALVTGHTITLEKKDGDVINVQDYLEKVVKKAKDSGDEIGDFVKKGVKDSKDFAHDLKENLEDKIHLVKEKVEDEAEDLKEEAEDLVEKIKDGSEAFKEELSQSSDEQEEKAYCCEDDEVHKDISESGEDIVKLKKDFPETIKDVREGAGGLDIDEKEKLKEAENL